MILARFLAVMGICPITELELLHSARSKAHRDPWLALLNATFAWVAMPDQVYGRAAEVQAAMTARGTHRSAGAVDLLLAATADLSGLILVHYDHDFDEIVKVTGQPAARVAAAGSIT
ncbi:PIN domain-containing protein [Dactylosporangium sp. CA-233914]|uniref:PIN domain-containing protein n=1 Tax=Dactylosporangium sp. CA-233914 TaxID=3239934 RepID=UPI003D8B1CFB